MSNCYNTYAGCGCGCGAPQYYPTRQATFCYNVPFGPLGVFDTVSALRFFSANLVQNGIALTKGQTAAYDDNGHFYCFEAQNTDEDDGVNIIKPSVIPADQPGRWRIVT